MTDLDMVLGIIATNLETQMRKILAPAFQVLC